MRLVGHFHTSVPEGPQERAVNPLPMADRLEEGGMLFLGQVEIGKPLKAEQGEPPLWVYSDV